MEANTLTNRQYFPTFDELPLMDEYVDPNYYADVGGGTMLPIKHWCYFADIIDDSLSHMADFYHRTEVRDITGHCNSLLFNPDDFPDFRRLKKGSTCFVRYASKAYFSDLMTQVIKVDDTAFVKIIGRSMDELVILSQWYFGARSCCACCRRGLQQGHDTSLLQCPQCQVANYCSAECLERHKPEHVGHCDTCCELQMVINVDMERFIQPVPFNTSHTQVFG